MSLSSNVTLLCTYSSMGTIIKFLSGFFTNSKESHMMFSEVWCFRFRYKYRKFVSIDIFNLECYHLVYIKLYDGLFEKNEAASNFLLFAVMRYIFYWLCQRITDTNISFWALLSKGSNRKSLWSLECINILVLMICNHIFLP